MKKKSFNRGMHTLMNKGYSKQSAFNTMEGLARKNNFHRSYSIPAPSWIKYLFALIFELILIFYKIPSKEDTQIMLIQTIIPLSPATQPLYPLITLLAIVLQLYSLWALYDLVMRIKRSFR